MNTRRAREAVLRAHGNHRAGVKIDCPDEMSCHDQLPVRPEVDRPRILDRGPGDRSTHHSLAVRGVARDKHVDVVQRGDHRARAKVDLSPEDPDNGDLAGRSCGDVVATGELLEFRAAVARPRHRSGRMR